MDVLFNPSNLKCSKHPKNQITFLQVSQLKSDKNIFYCEQCILCDKEFHVSKCVLIRQITEHSNNSQIVNWPYVDNETLQDQINYMQTQDKQSNQLLLQINQYFDTLKKEVFQKIEQCQKEMIKNALLFHQYEQQILKKLQECQMVGIFKSILLNSKTEINQKEKEYRDFVNLVHQQKHTYEQQLKQMFDNLNKKESQIDFKIPNQIKTQILQMIEKITFIKESNQANNIISQINIVKQNMLNIEPENINEKIQEKDLLSDLYLTKSNYFQELSQDLSIKKLRNNSIQIISRSYSNVSYYSNFILDRNKKYVFRFQFKTTKKQQEGFMIGLVRDETKDTNYSYNDHLSHYTQYGIDKCIKGDLRDTNQIDCVELRVCIEDEQLEVVDYPNYNHKYVLSDEYKNNLKTYQKLKLAVYLQYEIEVTLISAYLCQQFKN